MPPLRGGVGAGLFLDTRKSEFIAFSSFPHREINSVPIVAKTALEGPEIAQNLHFLASTKSTFGRTF